MKDEVRHQNLKMEWGDELLKKYLHSSFVNVFKGDDLINELLEIMETEDPKRNCFLKFLNPVIESLKDIDKKVKPVYNKTGQSVNRLACSHFCQHLFTCFPFPLFSLLQLLF